MTDVSFNESAPVEGGPAEFQGLWVHFPDQEQLTSHNFLYGRDVRSYGIDVGGSSHVLAGRKFQVVEFGEHQSDTFSVEVLIPHGSDYYSEREALRTFAASKETLVVRDNRGHVVFGVIQSLDEDHQSEGSSFSFQVQRVHREVVQIS